MKYLVTGAGGMIGGFLVDHLVERGHDVVAVDIKTITDWQKVNLGAFNKPEKDLRDRRVTRMLIDHHKPDRIMSLAFWMGGIGAIEAHPFSCAESSAITLNTISEAIRVGTVERFFLSGSACAYSKQHQDSPDVEALAEWMAWPAEPEFGYGDAKLFDEQACKAAYAQHGLETRIARYHNIYSAGPTTWTGGREKAPAAICRKVAEAQINGLQEIEVWGDGSNTRSYCWIDDCIKATMDLTDSDVTFPVNIGSSESVSVNQLVDIVEDIAFGKRVLKRNYNMKGAQGVRGRNSDNTLFESTFGWQPSTPLRDGLAKLYPWVYDQVRANAANTV